MSSAESLYQRILSGDRVALSRAITLIESQQSGHITEANALLDACMSIQPSAMRIAITGTPGAGKSSLIEVLGTHILNNGLSLAVLAIDPSSQISGGSILGDKTRMQTLSNHPKAYVRPSPAGSNPGGVAERTREAILLCETAGYDVILVETVGIGQAEIQVRTMTDLLSLVLAPGGGDEVQGIKRGILEVADLVIINKEDGAMKKTAIETQGQYLHALRVLHQDGAVPKVLTCSALERTGILEIWEFLQRTFQHMQTNGRLSELRNSQNVEWFEFRMHQEFRQWLMSLSDVKRNFESHRQKILRQEISVRTALAEMQEQFSRLLKNDG